MVERRSTVSRELRYWQANKLAPWEVITLSIFVLIIIGATYGIYRVDHQDYWDAYGCHTDGMTYNATADKLAELPEGCKEYHHFTGGPTQ
jgi:hypothetical protein